MKTKLKQTKGITLIALIITIIILLILAMVTIRILMNQGIIKHAQNATTAYNEAQENEAAYLTYAEGKMDKYAGATGSGTGEKEDNDWAYAWTYTEEKGWSNMITAGNPAEGDIIAKFYKTGNKITPPSLAGLEFEEGDEYHMTIEGHGNMGGIAAGATGYAWGAAIMAKATGQASEEPLIIPYVTEVMVGNGITNISIGAFYCAAALNTISMPSSISSIDTYAFSGCASLTNITLPSSLKSIGQKVFFMSNVTELTVPDSVETIEYNAFEGISHIYYNGTAEGAPWGAEAIN